MLKKWYFIDKTLPFVDDIPFFYLYLEKLKYLTHGQLYNNLGNIFNSDALFQNLCCRGF